MPPARAFSRAQESAAPRPVAGGPRNPPGPRISPPAAADPRAEPPLPPGGRVTARAGPWGRGLAAPGPTRPEAGARPPGTPRRDPRPPRLARGLPETRAEPVPPSKAAPLSAELPGGTRRPWRTFHLAAQHRGRPPRGEAAPVEAGAGGRDHPAEPRGPGFLCLLPPAGGRGRFPEQGNQIPGTLLKRRYLSRLMKCM